MSKETKNPNAEAVAEAVSKTEVFFKENSKPLVICIAAVIVLAVGIFLWHKYAYEPKVAEAQEQMYPAENNFRNAEYELALNGDGNVLGFAQIIDEYGARAGKSVRSQNASSMMPITDTFWPSGMSASTYCPKTSAAVGSS